MDVHVVTPLNASLYAGELEQNYRLRHRIFVERMHWEALRRADGRDIDEYDDCNATHLLVVRNEQVVGGLRFNSLGGPNLLMGHFSHMVARPLPANAWLGADWTRFYVIERPQPLGPSSAAGALYCSAMEYALAQGWEFLTFVSKPAMVEILVSIGWTVTPLGMPELIDGDLAIAAYIAVSEDALFRARVFCGQPASLLRDRRAGTDLPIGPEIAAQPVMLH
ncbi:MAG: acyl-homoserine-lactone synthase [Devosia sp.]|jgi:acyl-homoserine lactone synthase